MLNGNCSILERNSVYNLVPFLIGALVDEIAHYSHCGDDAHHQKTDDQSQRHSLPRQKELPRKGSMRPKYMTPNTKNIAVAATNLASNGASSPASRRQGASNSVK